jgi:hypothetical protein
MVPPAYESGIADLYLNYDCAACNGTVMPVLYATDDTTGSHECTESELVAGLPLRGDNAKAEVVWEHPAEIKKLANVTLCLKLMLTNCSVFSYWWASGG